VAAAATAAVGAVAVVVPWAFAEAAVGAGAAGTPAAAAAGAARAPRRTAAQDVAQLDVTGLTLLIKSFGIRDFVPLTQAILSTARARDLVKLVLDTHAKYLAGEMTADALVKFIIVVIVDEQEDMLFFILQMLDREVGRCRLTASKPELKSRLVSALETNM
jgi:hypothetical protein